MKYNKNKNNEIFAFEDSTPKNILDKKVKELELTHITEDEVKKLLSPTLDEQKETLKSKLKSIIKKKITSGFLFGSDIIKTDDVAQKNGQANYSLAITAMQNAHSWIDNHQYDPLTVIINNYVYYITFNGGLSGSNKPNFPINFEVEIKDNEVSWYKLGFLVSTENSNKYFTPQDMQKLYIQFNLYVTNLRKKYDDFKKIINSCQTIKELEKINQEINNLD